MIRLRIHGPAAIAAIRTRAPSACQCVWTGRLSPNSRSAEIPSIKKTVSQTSGRAGIEFTKHLDRRVLIMFHPNFFHNRFLNCSSLLLNSHRWNAR